MEKTREILKKLLNGKISLEDAESELKANRVEIIDEFVRIDFQRSIRTSIPEIVFAEGKNPQDIATISMNLAEKNNFSIITRIYGDQLSKIKEKIADRFEFEYIERARIIIIK
ncbi:MAG: hypothetical protein ACFFD2_02815, partial [Promethearchaeota archaeon]